LLIFGELCVQYVIDAATHVPVVLCVKASRDNFGCHPALDDMVREVGCVETM
jgi:hypothetical protein